MVELLLAAGADTGLKDNVGATPLLEAARSGQLSVMESLLRHGAKLHLEEVQVAQLLCECVFRGDMPLLRWVWRGRCRGCGAVWQLPLLR